MPPDRQAVLRQELVDAQRELSETLDRVGPDEWQRLSPNAGWTIQDLLIHLSTAEVGFVPTLRRMAAGEGGVPADFDPDRWNAGQLRRRRGETTLEQLRADLDAAHQAMLALLDQVDAAALEHRGQLSSGAEGSTEDNFRLVAQHKRTHTADIRAALAPPATPV